jgi:hypothetical protein
VVAALLSGSASQAPREEMAWAAWPQTQWGRWRWALTSLSPLRCLQDVNETWSLCYPELYEPGQHNLYFNKKEFVKCLLHGIYNSFVLFFVPMGTVFNSERNDGKDISDFQSFSLLVQTTLIGVMTMQVWPLKVGPGDRAGRRGGVDREHLLL